MLFDYVIIIIVTTFIVSIITERMVIQRLQISPGVEIINGRCRLKENYGKLDGVQHNYGDMHKKLYKPFLH
jgi:hypothetical protein